MSERVYDDIGKQADNPVEGQLEVWWVPQIPCKGFHWPVATPFEAKLLLDVLADYDLFQWHNNIKPDYSNAGGLNVFRNGDWKEWENEEFDQIDSLSLEQLRVPAPPTEAK